MITILFSILVVMVLLSLFGELLMRIRVSKKDPDDRMVWWRLGGDEVAAAYEVLFPNSRLPFFRRFVFWLVIAWSAAVLSAFLWQRN